MPNAGQAPTHKSERVVLDTNVLVSGLWQPLGNPAKILRLVLNDQLTPCLSGQILTEYREVLARPRLKFSGTLTNALLSDLKSRALLVAVPASNVPFADEDDRPFYDTARYCKATLITGNARHYPKESFILSPAEFLGAWLA
jgi:putative PIN family toxin of toxin-antitoxin system